MAKTRTHFVCRDCGGVQARWLGRCPDCGTWDALDRFVEPKPATSGGHSTLADAWADAVVGEIAREGGPPTAGAAPTATPLPSIEPAEIGRLPTGLAELDRVLGGGFVPGSAVLLGGDPGIGKSTLLLQAAARLAAQGLRVLYASSEESAYQTRLRAERLFGEVEGGGVEGDEVAGGPGGLGAGSGLDHLYILADANLARIAEQARAVRPRVCIVDSIQMVYRPDLAAAPGSVAQLRRCCMDLVRLAKVSGMAVVMVGHVTKDGQLAGPRLLEHLVDAVLSFEGDRHHACRVVRSVKNRFGTTLEVGLFEMTAGGLRELRDAGVRLDASVPGCVICPVVHGTRCVAVEIQALTAAGFPGAAKRKVSGLESGRLAMLIAVLEQRAGLRLGDRDVFASAVGGLRVAEPAADLAIALAIAGAHLGRRMPALVAALGEVGLGGEVRAVPRIEPRLLELRRLGCRAVVGPAGGGTPSLGIESIVVRTVGEAIEVLERVGPPASAMPDRARSGRNAQNNPKG